MDQRVCPERAASSKGNLSGYKFCKQGECGIEIETKSFENGSFEPGATKELANGFLVSFYCITENIHSNLHEDNSWL